MTPAAAAVRTTMTEDDWKAWVIDTAMWCGWRVVHFRPARVADGSYRTAVEGHKGSPDLLLARDGVVLLAELKSNKGRLAREQQEWLLAIGAQARVWRPRDQADVLRELRAPRQRGSS